jgi:hypothetical protein
MKYNISALLLFFAVSSVSSMDVTVEGGASSAPIYTLEGTGTSDMDANGAQVLQGFTYSMANVNSGAITSVGGYYIINNDPYYGFDVRFSGSSSYQIKSYGNLAVVSFNHKLNKADAGTALIRGKICDSGYITSSGKSFVEDDGKGGFYLRGFMLVNIKGFINKKNVVNYNVKSLPFTQTFDLSASQDWSKWLGEFTFSSNSKGGVTGDGVLTFGNTNDPVDTVAQTVKGTLSKTGIYSWSTTSKSKADSKVKVTIKNTSTDVIDGKNNITAAAQSRKF